MSNLSAEEQLKLYESDVNAEQKIREAVTKSFGGLTEESNLIHTYENQQFPSFYNSMNGYGSQSAGLDPLTLLQNAWGEQARMATAAQVARDAFDVRKASLDDSVKNYQNQWSMGYQGAQSAYDRWWAQKQHEDAMREAARQRAVQQAIANRQYQFEKAQRQSNNERLQSLVDQGINIDPETGGYIVGMTTPNGTKAWSITSPTQGVNIKSKPKTKITVGKKQNLGINPVNGYQTPVRNSLINYRYVR